MLFLLLAAGATLALPAAVRLLVDRGLAQPATIDMGTRIMAVHGYFLDLFALAVVLAVFTAARFYTVSWIGERVTADLRRAVYAHVLRQSPHFRFDYEADGVLVYRPAAALPPGARHTVAPQLAPLPPRG